MSERNSDSKSGQKTKGQDWLGLGLAVVGGFCAVSILLSLRGQESSNLLTAPVDALMNSLGPWAGLVLSVGLAGLGVMLFLRPEQMPSTRNLMGWIGSACGVSLIVGAISADSGGVLGGLAPAGLGSSVGLFVGLIVGLLVLVGTVWGVWLSDRVGAPKLPSHGALVPTRKADADGVSAAEAMALQPTREPAARGSEGPAHEMDVRLSGGIPAGTQALEPDTDTPPARPQASGAMLWDAGPVGVAAPMEDADAVAVEPEPLDEPEAIAAPEPTGLPAAPSWERLEEDDLELAVDAPDEPEVEDVATELEDEEQEEAAELDEEEGEVAELEDEELEEEEEEEEEQGVAELDEAEELAEEEEEEDDEYEEAAELEEEGDEEDYEEEEEDAEAAELEEEDEGEYEEAAELEEEDDEELEEEEGEELEEAAELEEEDEEEYDEAAELEEEEELEDAAELEDDEELEEEGEEDEEPEVAAAAQDSGQPEVLTGPPPASWEQVGLFDDEPLEPEHVLVPASNGSAEDVEDPEEAAAATAAEPGDVLLEAGRMILEENRVAVSMIQRRFSLDFDEACTILDRLQELGLIGPYVGGRNREILLGVEEWEALSSELAAS